MDRDSRDNTKEREKALRLHQGLRAIVPSRHTAYSLGSRKKKEVNFAAVGEPREVLRGAGLSRDSLCSTQQQSRHHRFTAPLSVRPEVPPSPGAAALGRPGLALLPALSGWTGTSSSWRSSWWPSRPRPRRPRQPQALR